MNFLLVILLCGSYHRIPKSTYIEYIVWSMAENVPFTTVGECLLSFCFSMTIHYCLITICIHNSYLIDAFALCGLCGLHWSIGRLHICHNCTFVIEFSHCTIFRSAFFVYLHFSINLRIVPFSEFLILWTHSKRCPSIQFKFMCGRRRITEFSET